MRAVIIASDKDAQDLLSGERTLDETYFGGRRKGKGGSLACRRQAVFGILEQNGIVRVDVIKDVPAESLLNLIIKPVRRGSLVYTDTCKSYDTLMFCG